MPSGLVGPGRHQRHRHLGPPFVPRYPGLETFAGQQLHSAQYTGPQQFAGQRVVIVGGGNTAAQLLAELSHVAHTTWVTPRPPRFLPDDVDGRALFAVATARRRALDAGLPTRAVSPVSATWSWSLRCGRPATVAFWSPGRCSSGSPPAGVVWPDGTSQPADVVLWCTGFRPDLGHLAPLGLRGPDGHIATAGTRAVLEPRVHLLGYGDWTGPGSATLIGVGRTAREAVNEIGARLQEHGRRRQRPSEARAPQGTAGVEHPPTGLSRRAVWRHGLSGRTV